MPDYIWGRKQFFPQAFEMLITTLFPKENQILRNPWVWPLQETDRPFSILQLQQYPSTWRTSGWLCLAILAFLQCLRFCSNLGFTFDLCRAISPPFLSDNPSTNLPQQILTLGAEGETRMICRLLNSERDLEARSAIFQAECWFLKSTSWVFWIHRPRSNVEVEIGQIKEENFWTQEFIRHQPLINRSDKKK